MFEPGLELYLKSFRYLLKDIATVWHEFAHAYLC